MQGGMTVSDEANRKEEASGKDPYPYALGRPVKKSKSFLIIAGSALGFCAFLVGLICLIVHRERAYYANQNNYIRVEGQIGSFAEYENAELYLRIDHESTQDPVYKDHLYGGYRIEGPSFALVKRRGLLRSLREGASVEYLVAPAIFGDGYRPPIVAITVDGTEYLSFEEGYENLRQWLRNWRNVL